MRIFIYFRSIDTQTPFMRIFSLFLSLTLKACEFVQNGLDTKVEKSRKQMKERKNRAKKIRGVKKVRGLWVYGFKILDSFLSANAFVEDIPLILWTFLFIPIVACADQG